VNGRERRGIQALHPRSPASTGAQQRPGCRVRGNVSPVTFRGDVPPLGQQPPLGADRLAADEADGLDRVVERVLEIGRLAAANAASSARLGDDLVTAKADAEQDHPVIRS